jgi:hypothetical protein
MVPGIVCRYGYFSVGLDVDEQWRKVVGVIGEPLNSIVQHHLKTSSIVPGVAHQSMVATLVPLTIWYATEETEESQSRQQ